MGKSSEEFMRQRERQQESMPLIDSNFTWGGYFKSLNEIYKKEQYEKRNI